MGASSTREYCRKCKGPALRGIFIKHPEQGLIERMVLCEEHRKEAIDAIRQ